MKKLGLVAAVIFVSLLVVPIVANQRAQNFIDELKEEGAPGGSFLDLVRRHPDFSRLIIGSSFGERPQCMQVFHRRGEYTSYLRTVPGVELEKIHRSADPTAFATLITPRDECSAMRLNYKLTIGYVNVLVQVDEGWRIKTLGASFGPN